MPSTVRLYEVVYIVAPDLSEEQVQSINDKYANLISNRGGTVIKKSMGFMKGFMWSCTLGPYRRLKLSCGEYSESAKTR
jgi:hypothetical protein